MDAPVYTTFLTSMAPNPCGAGAIPKMETSEDGIMSNVDDTAARKPWMKRAGSSVAKVAPEVKRRRKNYQAKKLLVPKNPLMLLHELRPGTTFTFEDKTDVGYFQASVELDGHTFFGKGTSKKQAQQEAAETALRGLYFDKLLDQLAKNVDDVDSKDVSQPTDGHADGAAKSFPHPEDDTPWGGLASLAMYKLVALWQSSSNGADGTAAAQAPIVAQPPAVSSSDLVGKLPPNAAELDPVMLLNQISPHSKFIEESRDVRSGSLMFTITVNFNGRKFSGTASKKKVAKKMCAKMALSGLGVVFNDSNDSNDSSAMVTGIP